LSRGALLTGTAGGIIGTITAGIGVIWCIIDILLYAALMTYINFAIQFYEFGFIFLLMHNYLGYYLLMILMVAATPTSSLALFFVFSLLLGVLLIVSCILTGVGFYGVYKAGGGAMGVVGLIFGIIGGVLGGLLILLGNMLMTPVTIGASEPNYLFIWIGFIILALAFILMGTASIVVRDATANSSASVAAGILSIIGACLFFPYILGILGDIMALIGFGLIFVAFILWAVVFYSSRNI